MQYAVIFRWLAFVELGQWNIKAKYKNTSISGHLVPLDSKKNEAKLFRLFCKMTKGSTI